MASGDIKWVLSTYFIILDASITQAISDLKDSLGDIGAVW